MKSIPHTQWVALHFEAPRWLRRSSSGLARLVRWMAGSHSDCTWVSSGYRWFKFCASDSRSRSSPAMAYASAASTSYPLAGGI